MQFQTKVIPVFIDVSRALGDDIEAAMFFQQCCYWAERATRTDGFFYKTKDEFKEETTLSIDKQDRIRIKLVNLGWLEVKRLKANGAPTLHYRPVKSVEIVINDALIEENPNKVKSLIQAKRNTRLESGKTPDSLLALEHSREHGKEHILNINADSSEDSPAEPKKVNEVNLIIAEFESVNPSFARLFPNKAQRSATDRLIMIHGFERLKKLVGDLKNVICLPYAPKITTPIELENNLGKLIAFMKQQKQPKKKLTFIS